MDTLEDWKEIEREYLSGRVTYRDLAKKYNLPLSAIAHRGRVDGWVGKRLGYVDQACKQVMKVDTQQQVQRTGRLLEVADRLLDRVEELGNEEGVTASSLKTLSETLKNIRDAQMIKSTKDLQEQQARIDKLRRENERGEQEGGGVTVRMEEKMGEFAA